MESPKFPGFPTLPTEIRLKIWHHALPASRLIDCGRIRERNPELTKRRNENYGWFLRLEAGFISPPLALVNQEARLVFLTTYTRIEGRSALARVASHDQNDPARSGPPKYIDVDFRTDTIFLSRIAYRHLRPSRPNRHGLPTTSENPLWTTQCHHVALHLLLLSPLQNSSGDHSDFRNFKLPPKPSEQARLVQMILNIFEDFPAAKTVTFTIDGRGFGSSTRKAAEFVDPSPEHEDAHRDGRREMALRWFEALVADVEKQEGLASTSASASAVGLGSASKSRRRPHPSLRFQLLVDGPLQLSGYGEQMERRWDYRFGVCEIAERTRPRVQEFLAESGEDSDEESDPDDKEGFW